VRRATSIVGLGVMGLRHARVLRGLADRFDLVGAYDLNAEAPTPADVPRLRDEREAIERAEVVVVATPATAHAGTVARALAAGKYVLVEKPLCATAVEAQALVAAAARGRARLFVGHSERFNPVVRVLARLLRDQRVVAIESRRVSAPRTGPALDVGVLVNLGVHDLDLAAYLGGGGVELRGAVGRGADGAHVLFATKGGAVGHISVDRTAPAKQRCLRVATTRWTYDGDLLAHRLVRESRATGARTDVPLPLDEPLAAQALALADALDGAPAREIASGADGARAVALAEQAAVRILACCASTAPTVHPSEALTEKLSLSRRP
jgi:predicted dehydrogenase